MKFGLYIVSLLLHGALLFLVTERFITVLDTLEHKIIETNFDSYISGCMNAVPISAPGRDKIASSVCRPAAEKYIEPLRKLYL